MLSCCARGGAWFKKCGDPGDPDYDHTWFEGIQACSSLAISRAGQALMYHETSIDNLLVSTRQATTLLQQSVELSPGRVSDAAPTNSQGCGELTEITVLNSLLIIILHMQI